MTDCGPLDAPGTPRADPHAVLLRFCIDDAQVRARFAQARPGGLDARTTSLMRIGALVALGGASAPTFHSEIDDAVSAGATLADIVAALEGLVDLVGMPRVVTAAQMIASAFGLGDDVLTQDGP